MLSQQDNDLVTRVGPGTPAGELLRRYWQPAALAEELPEGGAPVPVRLLGEDLVLFRDDQGNPGLLGLHCSHRGADLSYGRREAGGLRCIYHGWLYDVHGRCLEQPGEPAGSSFYEKIQHQAYPCIEAGGLILAYLGPGEPPLLPAYEFLTAPPEKHLVSKVFQECNYLQGNEGNIDPAHHSFLHLRFGEDEDSRFNWYGNDRTPIIEAEETDFGVRVYAVRRIDDGRNYVKITNFIFPNLSAITGDADGYGVNWHVPIDDTHHWKYNLTFRRSQPLSSRWRQALPAAIYESLPQYHPIRSASNRYLQDREEMKERTFAGLAMDFQAQDGCATEGAGPIQDRTQEHFGSTDIGIMTARKALIRTIREVEAGREAPHVVRDPSANRFPEIGARKDVVAAGVDWHTYWRDLIAEPIAAFR